MSRFEKYYDSELISEKITKKEASEALKNPNITIGAEFEFILNHYEGGSDNSYQDAYDDWTRLDSDLDEAKGDYEAIQNEMYIEEREIEDLQEKFDDAEYDLNQKEIGKEEAEEAKDEAYDEMMDADSEVKELTDQLEEDPSDEYVADELSSAERKLADAERDHEHLEDAFQDAESEYNRVNAEVESLRYDIDNKTSELESRQEYWQDEMEWPDIDSYSDYTNYMDEMGYEYESDLYMVVVDNYSYPEEPPESEGEGEIDYEENMEGTMMNTAPFDDYEYGNDSSTPSVGSTTWIIKPDGSLDTGGVEVVSPPIALPDFMDIFSDMLKWIRDWGSTNTSCGMHVHMGVKGVKDLSKELDMVKMILFLDEGYIWHAFPDREDNTYVQSAKDKLKSNGELPKDVSKLFDIKKIALRMSTQHYDAINFSNISSGHIEYRYLGGNDYEYKEKKLTDQIGRFAYNMSLGLDPTFKKREYQLKLQRIFNKMELDATEKKMEHMRKFMVWYNSGIGASPISRNSGLKLQKQWKEWEKTVKSLKKVYKLDGKTKGLLNKNRNWLQTVQYGLLDDLGFLSGAEMKYITAMISQLK